MTNSNSDHSEILPAVVDGYVAALTWVGLYEDGDMEPVDADPYAYGVEDLEPEFLEEIRSEVADFVAGLPAEDVDAYLARQTPEQMGHDFYLTRNRHGAGFWDRGLGELGDRLTKAAHPYGEAVAVLYEDGRIGSF